MCPVPPDERSSRAVRCVFAWCDTAHGETVHPDDETHRSAGAGFSARMREGNAGSPGALTDIEVGLIRRDEDSETWVVLEFGGGPTVALGVRDALTLGRVLCDDPDLLAALGDRTGREVPAAGRHRADVGDG